jgi:hypothetical protein
LDVAHGCTDELMMGDAAAGISRLNRKYIAKARNGRKEWS